MKPRVTDGELRYAEKSLGQEIKPNALTLVLSGEAHEDAIEIRADAKVYFGKLDANQDLMYQIQLGRGLWLYVIEGDVAVMDESLARGDGAAIENVDSLKILSRTKTFFILFDLK